MGQHILSSKPRKSSLCTSHISIALDNIFATGNVPRKSESLVPSEAPPEYPSLSPWPPCLSLEPALLVPLFTWAPSNLLSVQEILHHGWSGIGIDQVTFTEGQITFRHLRAIDQINNPQFYSDLSDAADEDSQTRFHEDRENKGEEELQEEEDHNLLPQPIHSQTQSTSIPGAGNVLRGLQLVPFQNDNQWEQFLHSEIERIFET